MSITTIVKDCEPHIYNYLDYFLAIPEQKAEDFVECTSQKIETYIQEVFEDIKKAVKEKASTGKQCFSIEKNLYCNQGLLNLLSFIFKRYQIILKNQTIPYDLDNNDTYFDLMDPIKLKENKQNLLPYVVTFHWTPKNPHIYEPQGIET